MGSRISVLVLAWKSVFLAKFSVGGQDCPGLLVIWSTVNAENSPSPFFLLNCSILPHVFCRQLDVKCKIVLGAHSQFQRSIWANFHPFSDINLVDMTVENLVVVEWFLYPFSARSWGLWFECPFNAEVAHVFGNIFVFNIWLLGLHFNFRISWKILRNNGIFILCYL